ncbi:putative ABC transporter ATP-binding protein [bacterium BMS3Bbin06]|nr:putative ABC transporter ATP-binding protein [bacterium BMS3Abin08]GBE35798.1 putative ABC transporter ATP-binding protein [bacterium BMS3Bbin06]HDY71651.1 ATP-binding cassette domain-containing protein [Nitrospirota bacterium]
MSNEPDKIIYSMVGVSKYYDKKPVLKDIYLSYFYGAKIGVLGLNGSGKSSLLRILAGKDRDFNGETVLSPGHTVGLLEQEPELDDTKTVREIVEEGVKETVNTMRALEEALENFAGCVVIISHDRWFLDRIATHILAFEGDSRAVWFDGNYSEYEADRQKRLGTAADQPHRIKYRHLTRG